MYCGLSSHTELISVCNTIDMGVVKAWFVRIWVWFTPYYSRCVQNCSVVEVTLPANSTGLFQNEETNECQSCDTECVGGCIGGIVSHMTFDHVSLIDCFCCQLVTPILEL